MTSVTSCALISSPFMLTWVPTAHSGLLQTFAHLVPCISRTCVVSRMCAVSVIVDLAPFLSSEARLYHLDKGLLLLCIRLTKGSSVVFLYVKPIEVQKIHHSGWRICYSEGILYPFGHAFGIGIVAPTLSKAG